MSEAPTNSRQRDALDREELAFGGGRFSRGGSKDAHLLNAEVTSW